MCECKRNTIPFDFHFFYSALTGLIGREPDSWDSQKCGEDKFYEILYKPKDSQDTNKLRGHTSQISYWLTKFQLKPIGTICEYGYLIHPEDNQKDKEFLYIKAVFPVNK